MMDDIRVSKRKTNQTEPLIDPFFSKINIEYVEKSVNELRSGKGTVHELIEIEDFD